MISTDFRFEGFDERSWLRVLSLLGVSSRVRRRGRIVVVTDDDDRAIAAFMDDGTPVPTSAYRGRAELAAMCEQLAVPSGLVLRSGALEFVVEQAAQQMAMPGDYLAQCLALLSVLRRAEQAGAIVAHPSRRQAPVPTARMVDRTVDLVLPNDRSIVIAVYEGQRLWTALVLRRRGGQLDLLAGPRTLAAWTGPIGGDYRRDHRTIRAAVGRNAAPVHLGIFAERRQLTELLANPVAGAWAAALATRDVVVEPAPPYIGVAAAADAGRALSGVVREFLGGVDLAAAAAPVTAYARRHLGQVGRVSSVRDALGFNPLEALAERLRRTPPGDAP